MIPYLASSQETEEKSWQYPAKKSISRPARDPRQTGRLRKDILTPAALAFLTQLHRYASSHAASAAAGPDASARPATTPVPCRISAPTPRRSASRDWRVAPIPAALQDRRVEITGPVERKMIINALNSGAKVFMADFEDSSRPPSPTARRPDQSARRVNGTIEFTSPEGKDYASMTIPPCWWCARAAGICRAHVSRSTAKRWPARWSISACTFSTTPTRCRRDRGPYFYLPKLEAMEEAALWDDVMALAEDELGLPTGTMKATVLIETLPAAFQMDEILHALRDRIVGLNCGRWDYIFSYMKTLRRHRDRLLPERGQV
jgi:malate synthase